MSALIQTATSVLRYRGGSGQWAWAIHRAAGLGVLAFLLLHIFDIFLVTFGPGVFNEFLFLYKAWPFRILEVALLFGLIYHAFNGLRIILADFYPVLAKRSIARTMFYVQVALTGVLFAIGGLIMLITAHEEPFQNNYILSLIVVIGIVAVPLGVSLLANYAPTASTTALDVDTSSGNYDDSIAAIVRGRQRRRMDRTEINIWLFMRISGFLLIFLALLHFFLMHFVYGVDNIDFNFVVSRWTDPFSGWFWRAYDLALLVFALTHGVLGARYSIEDYFHNRAVRFILLAGAVLTWVALIAMGAFVIFTFNPSV
jgi:succinate dehydrogenase / fumarate reductase cytochrome b subunit